MSSMPSGASGSNPTADQNPFQDEFEGNLNQDLGFESLLAGTLAEAEALLSTVALPAAVGLPAAVALPAQPAQPVPLSSPPVKPPVTTRREYFVNGQLRKPSQFDKTQTDRLEAKYLFHGHTDSKTYKSGFCDPSTIVQNAKIVYICKPECEKLVEEIKLTKKQVLDWFTTKRGNAAKAETETD